VRITVDNPHAPNLSLALKTPGPEIAERDILIYYITAETTVKEWPVSDARLIAPCRHARKAFPGEPLDGPSDHVPATCGATPGKCWWCLPDACVIAAMTMKMVFG